MNHLNRIRILSLAILPSLIIATTGSTCPSVCGTSAGVIFSDQDSIEQDLVVNQDGIVSISFASEDFDPFLELYDEKFDQIASDDDSGDGNTALISQALRAGTYRVIARPYRSNSEGAYFLTTMGEACLQPHVPGPNEVDRNEVLFIDSEQLWSFSLLENSKVIVTTNAEEFEIIGQIMDDTFTPLTNEFRGKKVVLVADLAAGAYFVRCASRPNESGAYSINIFAPEAAAVDVAQTPSERGR